MECLREKMDKNDVKAINADEIRKWHKLFKRDSELFEIRLLGEKVYSGYFIDAENAILAILHFDRYQQYQVYFSVNEVNPACSSRKQFETFLVAKGTSTSKNDIIHRWWLPIDIDVKRPSDISSTEEEKQYAHRKAVDVYRFLNDNSFPSPIVCDSSSGYHLYYPLDMPNDIESENIVHGIFSVLSARFTDDRVKIDKAVTDANRIMRLPGTWGRKGRDTEERPHRMARILTSPDIIYRCDKNFLSAFVDRYKVVEDKPSYRLYNGDFNLRNFIREHGLNVRSEVPYDNGGTKFVLEECPFDPSHKAPDSALFLSASGAIGFKCFHDSCSHHTWHDLRMMLDPTAYAQQSKTNYSTQKQFKSAVLQQNDTCIAVKDEDNDLGKKWLSLTEVDDVNTDDLPRINTGFTELSRKLGGGLFFKETTIMSGINGSGKSSWLNTLILNTIQEGYKTALWTGELPSVRLKRWLVQVAAGDDFVKESQKFPGTYYVDKSIITKISEWTRGKFFLYNNNYPPKNTQLLSDMQDLVGEGVKLFVLDNLFAMDLDSIIGDDNVKQKTLILSLVRFAKENDVHVLLVAHPRKVVTFLRKEDILGSSALQNAVDNIFIIHRVGEDFERRGKEIYGARKIEGLMGYGNVIEICKNREFGAIDELIGLHYSQKSRRFSDDFSRNVHYGWETGDIHQQCDLVEYNIDKYTPEVRDVETDFPFVRDNVDDDILPF